MELGVVTCLGQYGKFRSRQQLYYILFIFRLDKDEIIDATTTGAMARFMNHCCEPNAYARIISFFKNDIEEKHIVIMAARDIQVRSIKIFSYCLHSFFRGISGG